jgi:hypothetical protein
MNRLFMVLLLLLAAAFSATVGAGGAIGRSTLVSLAKALQQMVDNVQFASELEARSRAEAHRELVREEIVADLLADQITLTQAAARFGQLNKQMPNGGRRALDDVPGDSLAERLCRQVIIRTEIHVKLKKPNRSAPGTIARLESRLKELLEQGGMILLPEVQAGDTGIAPR